MLRTYAAHSCINAHPPALLLSLGSGFGALPRPDRCRRVAVLPVSWNPSLGVGCRRLLRRKAFGGLDTRHDLRGGGRIGRGLFQGGQRQVGDCDGAATFGFDLTDAMHPTRQERAVERDGDTNLPHDLEVSGGNDGVPGEVEEETRPQATEHVC